MLLLGAGSPPVAPALPWGAGQAPPALLLAAAALSLQKSSLFQPELFGLWQRTEELPGSDACPSVSSWVTGMKALALPTFISEMIIFLTAV